MEYYSHTFPLAASVGHLFSSLISSLVPVPRRQKGWWLGGSYEDSSQVWSWDSQPGVEMAFTHWHPLNTHNNLTEDCLVLLDSRQGSPLSLVELQRGSALIGPELQSFACASNHMP